MEEVLLTQGPGLLFYLFAGLALISAILVITLRNPMYCAIALLLCFLTVACLFFLRHAEFVGVVQIFVYGGGIMVLFLFVIMLVNLYSLRDMKMFLGQSPWAAALAVLLACLFGFLVTQVDFGPAYAAPEQFVEVEGQVEGNSEVVAMTLYTDYLLPFEIASVFLLVAMIGAVVLGRKQ